MSKSTNTPLHYKMYKSGKSWVFAGIVSAGLALSFGGTVAQADTPDTTTDPTTTTEKAPTPETPVATTPTAPVAPNTPTTSKPVTTDEPTEPTTPPAPTKQPEPKSPEAPIKPTDDPSETENPVVHTKLQAPAPQPNEPTSPTNPVPTTPAPAPTAPTAPMATAAPLSAPVNESIDVWMPNKILQKMVAKAMGIDVSQITKDNIATGLTSLATAHTIDSTVYIDGQTPFSLEGLQYATNLTSLDLSYDNALDYMNLQTLPTGSGAYGDIVDLTPLANLTNLMTLNVSRNKIVNLKPLEGLKKLTTLNVMYNWIGDFSMLDAKQITSLKISHQNFVVDYAQQKFVDPTTHTITVAPLIQLPQNYNATLARPFLINRENFELVETQLQQIHVNGSPIQGHQIFSLYYSGMGKDDYTVNTDGSIQFTNIEPQSTYYYGGTYGKYADSVGLATPGNHKYYLRADLTSSRMDSFTILIPYDTAKNAAAITVQYRDEANDTTAIKPDLTFGTDKMTGDSYTLTPNQLAVDGYTYDDARNQSAAITGKFSDQAQTITLYYTKNATKPVTPPVVTPPVTPTSTVTVTVHYQDNQGNTLLSDAQLTGQSGTAYQVKTPVIKGYQLDSASNPTGTFGSADQTVTVTYHKIISNGGDATITPGTDKVKQQPDMVAPTKSTQLALTTHGGNAAKISNAVNHPQRLTTSVSTSTSSTTSQTTTLGKQQAKTVLPQTSEHRTSPLIGLGLLLASLIGITTRFRKRN